MAFTATHFDVFWIWLIHTTWQASLLIGLILLVQKVAGRWLGVRGRYCLWSLVLIRMLMPWAAPSRASLYNLLPLSPVQEYQSQAARAKMGMDSVAAHENPEGETSGSSARTTDRVSGMASSHSDVWFERWLQPRRIVHTLSLVWLAGACLLVVCIVVSGIRLHGIVRRGRIVTDRWVLRLLEDCKHLIGTHTNVDVIVTTAVGSPALFGPIRPKLLLPRETLARRNREELRHVFLHELAHLKRHDILVGHIVTALHVLHWFNPIIALGFRRMRADRELASDALALSVLDGTEAIPYGRTLVLQAEQLVWSQPRWMLAGLSADKKQLRQRITMISRFRRETYRYSPLTIAIVGLLACVGLTDGLADRGSPARAVPPPLNPWEAYARGDFRTTHQDKHTNIQRGCLINWETGKYLVVDGETVTCADEPGEAGLWEFRYDEDFGKETDIIFFYSVAAGKYLTCDSEGNLAVNCPDPDEAARWNGISEPRGVWIRPDMFKDRHLFVNDEGRVLGNHWNTDPRSWWDTHQVWRVKTSDNPLSNPEWQRAHIPGPD